MTLEEQYTRATGKSPFYEGICNYGAAAGEYTKAFVEWVKNLLTPAVARFRAGEELADGCRECENAYGSLMYCIEVCALRKNSVSAIAAYEAAVKGEVR